MDSACYTNFNESQMPADHHTVRSDLWLILIW